MNESAYPLSWPVGWPRCKPGTQERAHFGTARSTQASWDSTRTVTQRSAITIATARERLIHALALLGASDRVLSTNVRTREDGLPHSKAGEPTDPGVAVYFKLKGRPRVLACDKWDRVADNIAAIAKHIDAIRGQIRWGVGTMEQAFGGYLALPAMEAPKTWREILGVRNGDSLMTIQDKWKQLLFKNHPDRGGNANVCAEINAAYTQALADLA